MHEMHNRSAGLLPIPQLRFPRKEHQLRGPQALGLWSAICSPAHRARLPGYVNRPRVWAVRLPPVGIGHRYREGPAAAHFLRRGAGSREIDSPEQRISETKQGTAAAHRRASRMSTRAPDAITVIFAVSNPAPGDFQPVSRIDRQAPWRQRKRHTCQPRSRRAARRRRSALSLIKPSASRWS